MEKPVKGRIHNWYMHPETGRITGTYEGDTTHEDGYIDTSPVMYFQYIPIPNDSHPWRAETHNSIYRLGLPLVMEYYDKFNINLGSWHKPDGSYYLA